MLIEAIQRPVAVGGLMLHQPLLSGGHSRLRSAVAATFEKQLLLGRAAAAAKASRDIDSAHAAGDSDRAGGGIRLQNVQAATLTATAAKPRRRRNVHGQCRRRILQADRFFRHRWPGNGDILDPIDVVIEEHAGIEPQLIIDQVGLGVGPFIHKRLNCWLPRPVCPPRQRDQRKEEQNDNMHQPAHKPGQNQQEKESSRPLPARQNQSANNGHRAGTRTGVLTGGHEMALVENELSVSLSTLPLLEHKGERLSTGTGRAWPANPVRSTRQTAAIPCK